MMHKKLDPYVLKVLEKFNAFVAEEGFTFIRIRPQLQPKEGETLLDVEDLPEGFSVYKGPSSAYSLWEGDILTSRMVGGSQWRQLLTYFVKLAKDLTLARQYSKEFEETDGRPITHMLLKNFKERAAKIQTDLDELFNDVARQKDQRTTYLLDFSRIAYAAEKEEMMRTLKLFARALPLRIEEGMSDEESLKELSTWVEDQTLKLAKGSWAGRSSSLGSNLLIHSKALGMRNTLHLFGELSTQIHRLWERHYGEEVPDMIKSFRQWWLL